MVLNFLQTSRFLPICSELQDGAYPDPARARVAIGIPMGTAGEGRDQDERFGEHHGLSKSKMDLCRWSQFTQRHPDAILPVTPPILPTVP